MDFFSRQDIARQKTKLLVFCFILSIVVMILMIYAGAIVVHEFRNKGPLQKWHPDIFFKWHPDIFFAVTIGTLLVIILGSLYKVFTLRDGGKVIAIMLGGQRINPSTSKFAERQLLNIVEEMALASGIPVPPVYLMKNEDGINAFAAGYMFDDAAIGVSHGALEYLNRDELQGVIAHEFSHVLNGDMRLNIRLIGLLHGILLIAMIGYFVLRSIGSSSRGSSRNKKSGGGSSIIPILAIGCLLIVIGSIGQLFARLIKAAVSRQREFLADASAVQFTRNPDGIAGALKKIGGLTQQSFLDSPAAETVSHMFFACGLKKLSLGWFTTHPPLKSRIQRIDKHFDGKFPKLQKVKKHSSQQPQKRKKKRKKSAPIPPILPGAAALPGFPNPIPLDPLLVVAAVGAPTAQHLDYTKKLLVSLPHELRQATHDMFSARAVVFALLLDTDDSIRSGQIAIIEASEGEPTMQETSRLVDLVQAQPTEYRLPLIQMVQTSLLSMTLPQYEQFRKTVNEIVKADKRLGMFEFVVQRSLILQLDRHFGKRRPPKVNYVAVQGIAQQAGELLSILVHVGHQDDQEAQTAFARALSPLKLKPTVRLTPRKECSLSLLKDSLDVLVKSSPAIKKRLLGAAVIAVTTDGNVTVREAELLRAIADSLDCPLPPIVPGVTSKK